MLTMCYDRGTEETKTIVDDRNQIKLIERSTKGCEQVTC